MKFRKKTTGYTEKTMRDRQTGAGAYFLNYDVKNDTFMSAIKAGKCIGATSGGGSISIKPTLVATEIDGVPTDAMGLVNVESYECTINAAFIELNSRVIELAIAATKSTKIELGEAKQKYKKIEGKMFLEESDYHNNVTFIGDMAGYDRPVIVQIYNALSTDGLSLNPKDKADTVISMTFKGHVSPQDYENPPFAIFIPEDDDENIGEELLEIHRGE